MFTLSAFALRSNTASSSAPRGHLSSIKHPYHPSMLSACCEIPGCLQRGGACNQSLSPHSGAPTTTDFPLLLNGIVFGIMRCERSSISRRSSEKEEMATYRYHMQAHQGPCFLQ